MGLDTEVSKWQKHYAGESESKPETANEALAACVA